jgi:hypothetical protein
MCREAAFQEDCLRRVPELAGLADEREFHGWTFWMEELAEMTADAMADDLAECAEYMDGAGWIEDTRGHAVFISHN